MKNQDFLPMELDGAAIFVFKAIFGNDMKDVLEEAGMARRT